MMENNCEALNNDGLADLNECKIIGESIITQGLSPTFSKMITYLNSYEAQYLNIVDILSTPGVDKESDPFKNAVKAGTRTVLKLD